MSESRSVTIVVVGSSPISSHACLSTGPPYAIAADLPTTMPGSSGSLMWMNARKRSPNSSRKRVTFSIPPWSVTRVMMAQTRCSFG